MPVAVAVFLGGGGDVAPSPGQHRHRRWLMTLHVIFSLRWGKKRIEIEIKIRF
jgi:hypothetical protein